MREDYETHSGSGLRSKVIVDREGTASWDSHDRRTARGDAELNEVETVKIASPGSAPNHPP